MSSHPNHRRGSERRTETGPRWESSNPGKGSNSTHVAWARAKWKKRKRRDERRAGGAEMKAEIDRDDPVANDRPTQVGKWEFRASVEMRVQERNVTGCSSSEPPLEKGDVWFKMVLDISNLDDSGEKGVWGELETSWQWSLEEAVEQAGSLCAMTFAWEEYDEEKGDYVVKVGSTEFARLFDEAAARFRLVVPGVA